MELFASRFLTVPCTERKRVPMDSAKAEAGNTSTAAAATRNTERGPHRFQPKLQSGLNTITRSSFDGGPGLC